MKRIGNQHLARDARRGAATYVALFVLIPIAAVAFALLRVGISVSQRHVHATEDDRTLLLAEAGLAEGLHALRMGGSGNVGDAATPAYYGGGAFWTAAAPLSNDVLSLRSTAMFESGRVCLERLVFEIADGLFDSAIHSSTDLTISSQCMIDSFDSTLGTYASQLSGGFVSDGAVVRSNGDVTVDPSVEIHGDVHPGEDDSVSIAGSASVSGSLLPLPEDIPLACVSTPIVAPSGPLVVSGSDTLAPGSYNFSELTIETGGDLSIEGPAIVVIDEWEIESNAELIFQNLTGPIEVYVSGDVDLASNSMITTASKTAVDLQIYLVGGPGQLADLRSNSMFYGAIYACEGQVRVRSNFEIFGAVVADAVTLDSNAVIHYDEALQSLNTGFRYVVSTWLRTEFQDKALLINRNNPFQLLGIPRELLPLPGDAHL